MLQELTEAVGVKTRQLKYQTMRRWLMILILLCMPLQFSLAAVSAYCEHENGSTAQHAGHHHEADADHGDSSDSKAGHIAADSGECQAGVTTAIFGSVHSLAVSAPSDVYIGYRVRVLSPPPLPLPERPNWIGLA